MKNKLVSSSTRSACSLIQYSEFCTLMKPTNQGVLQLPPDLAVLELQLVDLQAVDSAR